MMRRHRALDDTIERARHYGAMARDALALFPSGAMKTPCSRPSSSASAARIEGA